MENTNETFDKVLIKAQNLGYAEPGNPKLDLNGFDAFEKLEFYPHYLILKFQK